MFVHFYNSETYETHLFTIFVSKTTVQKGTLQYMSKTSMKKE